MTDDAARPLVVVTEELDDRWLTWLSERCLIAMCASDHPDFERLLPDCQALVVRTYTQIGPSLLDRAPRLRVVGRAGVGLDNIDVAACGARGIEVVHTPDANTRAVVELVTAEMLDALRPRLALDHALSLDKWKSARRALLAPRQASDLTLGILGLGRVGRAMARVGAALDMRVLYNDLLEIPEAHRHGAEPVEVARLFGFADIVTVHIDERPSNRNFIGAELLNRLRSGAIFINASRGFVLDASALGAWLAHNPSARAILDVHEPEPFGPDYPLLGLSNVRLLPHLGAATKTAHENMGSVVEDVWRVLQGEDPCWPAPIRANS